ncbi:DNA-3-methyladenine glycosylase [Paenibacillus sp. BR2-3]|uniref:DNA-3-methyladenine glycosylase family protein n=1 Tax=Paenibacillus sp. BR2-3 TaxID=3048494 RepID=UPI0039775B8B
MDNHILVPEEFSFAQNLKYFSNAPNECLYHIKDQRIYKAIAVGEETPVFEISGEDGIGMILIRFLGDTCPSLESTRAAVISYVRDWLDLDTDLAPFYELAGTDVLLQRAVESFYGLRNVGIPDLFEAISWGIIGQQINLAFAYTLKRRLVENFGRHVVCEGEDYWIFPTAEDIARLSVQDLEPVRMTVKKCEYLIGVARLIAEGKLSKELLLQAGDFKKAERMLVAIRGIGPWTANYVLMRCLRIPSAFPIDDVGLHNSIKFLLGMDNKPTKEEILQLSATWTNWESYATFYLWRFLY